MLQYDTTIGPDSCLTTAKLDGELFVYCDTKIIPKTEWAKKNNDDKPDYWRSEEARLCREHVDLQHHRNRTVELLNHTKGENEHTE